MKKYPLILVLLALSAGTISSPVSENGKLRVQGLQLVNACGQPVQLKGVSSHGLQWFGLNGSDTACLNAAALDFIADETNGMGADVFRAAMYVDSGGYLSDPARFINEVNTLVDMAGARGMYIIIDWHILNPGDPNISISQAQSFWNTMSATHVGKDHVLYEIANEPNGVSWATIKNYHDTVIPVIRANDPDTIIIAGTPNWSQLGSAVVADPLSYTNIMYTFHFYAATHSTSMLTPYLSQLPIFASEWGTCEASGAGTFDYPNAQAFLDIMGGANAAGVTISWCNWSFADKNEAASELINGTCNSNNWVPGALTTSGQFIRDNINGALGSPANNWAPCVAGSPTITRTHTLTSTVTPTYTETPTYTVTPTPVWATAPLCEDFESGSLAGYWLSGSSFNGRIRVTGTGVPNAGSYHALLDCYANGTYSLNEIILHVDLSGVIDPQLSFYAREYGDETNAMSATFVGSENSDGVAVSDDGVNWVRVTSLALSSTYSQLNFALGPILAGAGMSNLATVRIKFQQYDNFMYSSDGIAFDDICITGTPPSATVTPVLSPTATPTPSPSFSASPTRTVSPSPSATATASPDWTATASGTPTYSPSATATYSHSPTVTVSPSQTSTRTPAPSNSPSPGPAGSLRLVSFQAAPNPNPSMVVLEIEGRADRLEAVFYSAALQKLTTLRLEGSWGPGWVQMDLKQALEGLSNGVYFYQVLGYFQGEPADPGGPRSVVILK